MKGNTSTDEWQTLRNVPAPWAEIRSDPIMFSRAVGKDLGPFFTAWGLPTSDTARQSVAALPKWMPADWPTPAEIAAARPKQSMSLP